MAKALVASQIKHCKHKFTRSKTGKGVVLNPLRHHRLTSVPVHRHTRRWGASRKEKEVMADRGLRKAEQSSGCRRKRGKPKSEPKRATTNDDWTNWSTNREGDVRRAPAMLPTPRTPRPTKSEAKRKSAEQDVGPSGERVVIELSKLTLMPSLPHMWPRDSM